MGKVKGDYAKRGVDNRDGVQSISAGEITADNYGARALAFIKGCGGVGFVIRAIEGGKGSLATKQPATEPQWAAWMNYFYSKEIPNAFALSHGLATVPCEWPEMFDYEAPQSDRFARLRPPAPPISSERRAEIIRRFEELAESVTVRNRKAKLFNVADLSPAMAQAHLATLSAENAKADLKLSNLGLRSLGLSPVKEEGAA